MSTINSKKDYILELLKKGKRFDGREGNTFRDIKIEYGVSVNAEGSARVKVGNTEVIAGVKMNVGRPYPDSPDSGSIIVTAEFSQIASPDFESGPPSLESIELARVVDRTIRESGAIDLKKLGIVEGEASWTVFIDVYIMNHDGNLLDTSSIAAMAALLDAKLPKLKEDNTVDYGNLSDKEMPIDTVLTATTVAKIGGHLIVDPHLIEGEAAECTLTVGTAGNNIHSMQKSGRGGFTSEELDEAIKMAIEENKKIQKLLSKRRSKK